MPSSLAASNEHPIAYFCTEYAISQDLPIYSGGLGVLAGDVIKQAADQDLPYVGVGLFYRQGYFIQHIKDGQQTAEHKDIDPQQVGLHLLTFNNGAPLQIIIPHQDGHIYAQAWLYQVGSISLYLLDTNIEQNEAERRDITRRLYDSGADTRIMQELVLGVGGVKLLHALNITPSVYHLNEGHSAFAAFELIADILHDQDCDFSTAHQLAQQKIVFTNHTVVAAGNDLFDKNQVALHMRAYAEAEDLPLDRLLDLGTAPDDQQLFSMATLALNNARQSNTVSKLHFQIARSVWPDYTFHSVTNGVHMPTWIAENFKQQVATFDTNGLKSLSESQIWQYHQDNKVALLDLVESTNQVKFSADTLTIVWARRFAGYKRADLVLKDIAHLKNLTDNQQIQIIFAGKAHPDDAFGQSIIEGINRYVGLSGLQASITFIPNYSLDVAKVLVAGADVWLNTPRRSQEASGTSGMKAGANGVLHLSISDGWMDEVNWQDIGWILPEEHTDTAIYSYLSDQILSVYHHRNEEGIPMEWVKRMRQTMNISWNQFSAERMLKEYRKLLYDKDPDPNFDHGYDR